MVDQLLPNQKLTNRGLILAALLSIAGFLGVFATGGGLLPGIFVGFLGAGLGMFLSPALGGATSITEVKQITPDFVVVEPNSPLLQGSGGRFASPNGDVSVLCPPDWKRAARLSTDERTAVGSSDKRILMEILSGKREPDAQMRPGALSRIAQGLIDEINEDNPGGRVVEFGETKKTESGESLRMIMEYPDKTILGTVELFTSVCYYTMRGDVLAIIYFKMPSSDYQRALPIIAAIMKTLSVSGESAGM